MTVSTTIASKTYDGDGATTIFPTVFAFFSETDVEVIERVVATGVETVKSLTTDYTVDGGNGAPGNVNALAAPPATVSWTVRRVLSETQETDLPVAGSLPSDAVEQMGDRSVMMIQQHSEELGRTLSFPKTDSSSLDPTLPNSVDRAGKFLAFDSSGKPSVGSDPGLQLADGTAAAPTLTFDSDTDTGLYRVTENFLGFSSAGSEIMRVGATGVGINGTPDASSRLAVYQSSADAKTLISAETDGFAARLDLSANNAAGGQSNAVTSRVGAAIDWRVAAVVANAISFQTGSAATTQARVTHTASAVNFLTFTGGTATNAATLGATGSDANIGIRLQPAGTGQIEAGDGTASLPMYSFTADKDTGIRRAAADEMALVTGGTDRLKIDSSGAITMPHQPAMFASVPANIINVTGDGTAYTVDFGTAIYDQNSDWNGSTTFTAPVTGKYQVNTSVLLSGMTSNNIAARLNIVTSNRIYSRDLNPFAVASTPNQVSISNSVLADMDAADTLTVEVIVSATDKGVGVLGTGGEFSWLSVHLAA